MTSGSSRANASQTVPNETSTAQPPPLFLEEKGRLRAGQHRFPDPVGELRRDLARQDVKLVLVIHVEDLGNQAGADGVGLAQAGINGHPHAQIVTLGPATGQRDRILTAPRPESYDPGKST